MTQTTITRSVSLIAATTAKGEEITLVQTARGSGILNPRSDWSPSESMGVEERKGIDDAKKCKVCGFPVGCVQHGISKIDEYDMGSGEWMYSCGGCVEDYGTALGSIVHNCIFDEAMKQAQKMSVDDWVNLLSEVRVPA